MKIEVKSLHVYPIKSCGAIDLKEAHISERGFLFDRQWMVVTANGQKVTQRDNALMALVKPTLNENHLILNDPTQLPFAISLNKIPSLRLQVDIWGHVCQALDEGDAAAKWLSASINQEVRLVRFDPDHTRYVDRTWAGTSGAHTGFSDILPFLITSEESLEYLNTLRTTEGLKQSAMTCFRPNIVIKGAGAFGEDDISTLKLPSSDGTLELVRPCSRCVITNIDQVSGRKESFGNLQILGKHRTLKNYVGKKGAMFGVQALPKNADGNVVKIGDLLTVTQASEGFPSLPRFI